MGSKAVGKAYPFAPVKAADVSELVAEGLRQNNLKNLTVRIPHDRITVVCGPSGSGKSSLAFDTLFAEGRWRFIQSLSTYTRLFLDRMDRPDFDAMRNIRPAIALEQKNPVRSSRSTVGTATELTDCLRLLYARAGRAHCPGCGREVPPCDPSSAAAVLAQAHEGARATVGYMLEGPADAAALAGLVERGYIRIKAGGEVHDLTEGEPGLAEGDEVMVVTDRVRLGAAARTRLAEALEAAFSEGGGDAVVDIEGAGVKRLSSRPRCAECRIDIEPPTPLLFSFNHPVGACPRCKGFGNVLRYDEERIVPDRSLSLSQGAIEPWTKPSYRWWYDELRRHAARYSIDLDKPFDRLSERERRLVYEGTPHFEGLNAFFEHLETKKYKLHIRVFISRYKGQFTCPDCKGARLRPAALAVTVGGLDIASLCRMTVEQARAFFRELELGEFERAVASEVLRQIAVKLDFLCQIGLGYLTLDRAANTLSGGEAQRVAIANQLASTLTGVLYILDEPSIGLHRRDIDMLVAQIKRLAGRGNTVVVVEHDQAVLRSSDHVIELGPGAGELGGRIVWSGPTDAFLTGARTLTSRYLRGEERIHVPRWRRKGGGRKLTVRGARGNNLKGVDFELPLGVLTCVTGVSGSGKSTLVMDTLYNALARRFGLRAPSPLPFDSIEGTEHIGAVKLIDQSPIGRTPRSNPITYIGGFDDIRHFFASLPAAAAAGAPAAHFSFNVPGGRCETCRGEGVEKLEMYFLPDVYIRCASCSGRRYKPRILDIRYRRRNIYDVLNMTFDEALPFFRDLTGLQRKIAVMKDVGLGYLRLGQSATTLSGGEAQRLKVARELAGSTAAQTLYILDEPTTGLHMDDIKKLMRVLGRLVDSGNTVLVVEHNLDCIKTADHVVDLGPGGGERGGEIVASGTPEEVAASDGTVTGLYLREVLGE
ncbi:MAG TPA: excinuclease ABC subunit A [Deltaproteobacteria bacterium]|nr:excinuclease ABC subunit A [Deltaproteobacteria bacterium]